MEKSRCRQLLLDFLEYLFFPLCVYFYAIQKKKSNSTGCISYSVNIIHDCDWLNGTKGMNKSTFSTVHSCRYQQLYNIYMIARERERVCALIDTYCVHRTNIFQWNYDALTLMLYGIQLTIHVSLFSNCSSIIMAFLPFKIP